MLRLKLSASPKAKQTKRAMTVMVGFGTVLKVFKVIIFAPEINNILHTSHLWGFT